VTTAASYGTWTSPISAAVVTAAQVGLGQPTLDRDTAYWLEARPQEGGRSVLMRRRIGGAREEVTPAPFNVRTRVHEYGGGAYAVCDDLVVAVDFADQRLYRLAADGARALTPASTSTGAALMR